MIKSILAVLALAVLLVLPSYVMAQGVFEKGCTGHSDSTLCNEVKNPEDPVTGSSGILSKVVDIILIALGVASVIMIIIGGFKYVTSSGDSANVTSAKNTILYAIIGLIVAVMARPIINFVVGRF